MRRSWREVEGQVQGQAQLDDAEVAGEVGGANAEHAHQFVADFLGQLRQLGVGQAVQVRGEAMLRQQWRSWQFFPFRNAGLRSCQTMPASRPLPIALQDERDQCPQPAGSRSEGQQVLAGRPAERPARRRLSPTPSKPG